MLCVVAAGGRRGDRNPAFRSRRLGGRCGRYAGGYGLGSGYWSSVALFCEAVAQLAAAGGGGASTFRFAFAPHPGYEDAAGERRLFARLGCGEDVVIVPAALSLTTAQLVVAANASLSAASTVGGQVRNARNTGWRV